MPERDPSIDVRLYSPEDASRLAGRIWPCYRDVFADIEDLESWRSQLFDRHAARAGYRLAVAMDGSTAVGFAWGYIGQRGQYWTDLVCDALPSAITDEWVGGHFEFVELAVLPGHRRQGLGLRLHDTLLADVTHKCLLSTTDDPADPAVQLYLRRSWRRLGALKPGVQVMGRAPSS